MLRIKMWHVMVMVAVLAVWLSLLRVTLGWSSSDRSLHCASNLRNVTLAVLGYVNNQGHFPAGTHINAKLDYGDRLSWYVAVLPWLDFQRPSDVVEPDGRWNEGVNKALSLVHIDGTHCLNQDASTAGLVPASYIGIAGVGTDAPLLPKSDPRAGIFGYDRVCSLADIKDGVANTMLLAETAKVSGSWLQGGPATVRGLDPAQKPYLGPNRQFGGMHRGARGWLRRMVRYDG